MHKSIQLGLQKHLIREVTFFRGVLYKEVPLSGLSHAHEAKVRLEL